MNLNELQPTRVFHYFRELSGIPHGSGNVKAISDYCYKFARDLGLEARQDQMYNVVIKKPASSGYEAAAPVIIQGHLDMVCEKEKSCPIDMETEAIKLVVEGDYLTAKGTTLGGDDGIAIAMAMALLEAKDIPHPPIEAVFTTDEEVGMDGALALDVSDLKGKTMLNLDNEVEGMFIVSCAGGLRVSCRVPMRRMTDIAVRYQVSLTGISGGHSGTEINRYGMNSNIAAGRLLHRLSQVAEFWIHSMKGGLKDNAIPVETEMTLYVAAQDCQAFEEALALTEAELAREYRTTDPGFHVICKKGPEEIKNMLDSQSTDKIIRLLMTWPYGVQRMSADIPGLTETSLNLGILELKEDQLVCSFSIRSSVTSAKEALTDKLVYLTEADGGTCEFSGDYPGWEYAPESRIRELAKETWMELYHKDCQITALHAGLECGVFASKIPGLDCISIGPDLLDIHTPREKLSISSTERVWNFTLELLKKLR